MSKIEMMGDRKVRTWATAAITAPLSWRKPAMVQIQGDLFGDAVPFEHADQVFAVMALCPHLTFQVLTKRPERMAEYLAAGGARKNIHVYDAASELLKLDGTPQWERMPAIMRQARSGGAAWWPLRNVWLGTSVEDQARADERIPHLLRCPAKVRFLSCEPLLGHVDILIPQSVVAKANAMDWLLTFRERAERLGITDDDLRLCERTSIDWVIVGGESGPNARPCDVGWIRSIVQQCKDAGVACFVKQLGARPYEVNPVLSSVCHGIKSARAITLRSRKGSDPAEWPEDLRVREFPEVRP